MKPAPQTPPSASRRYPAPALVAALTLIAGIALAAVAIAGSPASAPAGTAAAGSAAFERPRGPGLRRIGSCAKVRAYARRHREALAPLMPPGAATDVGVAGTGAESAAPSGGPAPPTNTNVQEQGVDEPDLVKSDGSTIFAISENRLEAVDVSTGNPLAIGSLELPAGPGENPSAWGSQLLLIGERMLVISNADLGRAPWTRTIVSEIDVSDPAAMSALRTLTFDGSYVSARLTGSTARIVTSVTPSYPFAPEPGPIGIATPRAGSGGHDWLPQARLRDRTTGEVTRRPLVGCRQIRKPRSFSGLGMLSVLTIDLERGLEPVDADSVMTAGEIVYASPQALYVATERWSEPGEPLSEGSQVNTAIHKFAIADPGATEYEASGRVPGYMLSQWSMSEHEGLLRVASTSSPPWDAGGETAESESFVSVLGQSDERLTEVGRVGGLGRGERIYAVRFIGEVGYVVTFRQVDPLYTLDLSEPAQPRVLGELKIPGYSAYLHPVGPGRLLGIGQDADADGRTLGVQASLFDVADLTAPAKLAGLGFGRGSSSEVEYDHHAFLYDEPQRLAVLPLEIWRESGEEFAGAVGFRVDPGGAIEEPVRLSHGESWRAAIHRSLVVGDRLFTVSARGVMAHELAGLGETGWAAFPG
jgi:uncharacterized secreted protein with C-terminal beta-propeller domain